MTDELKEVMSPNLFTYMLQVQEHVRAGWEIDAERPPYELAGIYHATMRFNLRRARDNAQQLLDNKPIMTDRKEIMAIARASRGKNKEQQDGS